MKMKRRTRAAAKAITWRIIASATTALIVYGSLRYNGFHPDMAVRLGGVAALLDMVIKLVLFMVHDELWHKLAPREERS
tara:strand:- start:3724 stop:3960 length:237 start_codon:yes stop_codon:yes gene_type:complete